MFELVKGRFLVPEFSFVVDSECSFVPVNPFKVFLSRRMYRLFKKRMTPSALEVDESISGMQKYGASKGLDVFWYCN